MPATTAQPSTATVRTARPPSARRSASLADDSTTTTTGDALIAARSAPSATNRSNGDIESPTGQTSLASSGSGCCSNRGGRSQLLQQPASSIVRRQSPESAANCNGSSGNSTGGSRCVCVCVCFHQRRCVSLRMLVSRSLSLVYHLLNHNMSHTHTPHPSTAPTPRVHADPTEPSTFRAPVAAKPHHRPHLPSAIQPSSSRTISSPTPHQPSFRRPQRRRPRLHRRPPLIDELPPICRHPVRAPPTRGRRIRRPFIPYSTQRLSNPFVIAAKQRTSSSISKTNAVRHRRRTHRTAAATAAAATVTNDRRPTCSARAQSRMPRPAPACG